MHALILTSFATQNRSSTRFAHEEESLRDVQLPTKAIATKQASDGWRIDVLLEYKLAAPEAPTI